MKRIIIIISFSSIFILGCASNSKDIMGTYISPLQYTNYNCNQIREEMSRVQVRATSLGGRIDKSSSNDKALVATSIIFWPTLFFIAGDSEKEAEFARLKGELDAVQQAAIANECTLGNKPSPTQAKNT